MTIKRPKIRNKRDARLQTVGHFVSSRDMLYIIDANNLSGALGLIDKDDFDKILISKIKEYFLGKKSRVFLVFDSLDPVGDHVRDGLLEVVYTPRDSFYKDADDKVLEIAERFLEDAFFRDDIIVVTDDIDLRNKVDTAISFNAKKHQVKLLRASDLARLIKEAEQLVAERDFDEKDLGRDSDKINRELLRIWGKD